MTAVAAASVCRRFQRMRRAASSFENLRGAVGLSACCVASTSARYCLARCHHPVRERECDRTEFVHRRRWHARLRNSGVQSELKYLFFLRHSAVSFNVATTTHQAPAKSSLRWSIRYVATSGSASALFLFRSYNAASFRNRDHSALVRPRRSASAFNVRRKISHSSLSSTRFHKLSKRSLSNRAATNRQSSRPASGCVQTAEPATIFSS